MERCVGFGLQMKIMHNLCSISYARYHIDIVFQIYEGKIMIGVVPCISVPVGAQSNVNLESVPSLTSDFGVSKIEMKVKWHFFSGFMIYH